MYRPRTHLAIPAIGAALAVLIGMTVGPAAAHPVRAATPSPKSVAVKSVAVKPRAAAKKRVTTTTRKPTKKPRPGAKAPTSIPAKPGRAQPTLPPISAGASTNNVEGGDAGNPNANATVATASIPVVAAAASTTVVAGGPTVATTPATTTTTMAPYPAAANPATRATAASMVPYYGLGTWVDAFDWTVQKGGKVPRVGSQTVDAMAAAGVQTLFIQAARFDSADVAEPERLIPIINRAHELGLYVVAWYLPTFTDVNADLRRTVAVANLDVDGISIDIEARNVANVTERNRRLISYSQSLRLLLPGRFISNNIVQPNILEAVPNIWPTEYGKPPATPTSYWTPFPYADIAAGYDLWMIQSYWTQRSAGGGWRDAYRISVDNAARLRALLGRPDLPVYLIGGVGDRPLTANDLSGWLQALSETRSVGASFYDWLVTPASWWPGLWSTRAVTPGLAPDPRFVPVLPPPYVAPTQPVLLPPTTTVPPTTAGAVSTAVPTATAVPVVTSTGVPTTPVPTVIIVGP